MINEIIEFKTSFLDDVIKYLINKKDNIDSLTQELGIDIINENNIGTIIIKPKNELFIKIVLSVANNSLQSISFYGKLSFSFSDLANKYGKYREAYSAYDDLYLYFFNENTPQGIVIIYRTENKIEKISPDNLKLIVIDFREGI